MIKNFSIQLEREWYTESIMKNIILTLTALIIIIGGYFYFKNQTQPLAPTENRTNQAGEQTATTTPVVDTTKTVLGTSVEGNEITAYHFGQGDTELLFVGGIHGGYEWNTVLVARELMDYLQANPTIVPSNVKVTIIPVLNPDGLKKVTGTTGVFAQADVSKSTSVVESGRFNGNNVDLNRNFDCDWKAVGTWQTKSVSGGTAAFSEPESAAIKTYIETTKPTAVITWYSAAGGVFASSCHNGVSAETSALTKAFAKASGYSAYESFDFYATTGDMTNWLAKSKVPAISILLTNHTDTEWEKNKAGVEALLKYYAK